ncbi:hypothetical protein [Ferrimicrobium acidiphilum]|uniref:hypothetical protein n=1 Tax=Ferrimicrobium acidiphilum TaxID=121039 RepID=UPI0023EF8F41|nr:hypothetical protein [Ferrimicrobium acidiphilum]
MARASSVAAGPLNESGSLTARAYHRPGWGLHAGMKQDLVDEWAFAQLLGWAQ